MKSMPEHCRDNTSAASISQRLISQWVIKQGRRDRQFQILLQWPHTPIQPNIVEGPSQIPHPLKNTFMSWSLQKRIPRKWPKIPSKSTQTPPYLHLYPLTCLFKSGLVSIMKMAPFSPADQEHVNTAQVVELILEKHQDTIHDLSIALEWFVKTVPNTVHVQLGYSSVCAWWVPRYVMEVHENGCLEVLLHFFSHLKEEKMGSQNPWWYCETWFRHFTWNAL